jgi:hypothetical protein
MRSGTPAEWLPVLTGVVVIMAAIAGCTLVQTGTPTAAGGRPAAPTTTFQVPPNGAEGITLPPRPADVPLTGVDPCSLLTAAQQPAFSLTPGVKGLPDQLADNSPTCDYRPAAVGSSAEISVAVDTSSGIELWLNPNLADHIQQVSVGGFPALDITLRPPDLLQGCTTAVSTAAGQMFMVQLGQPDQGATTTQSCARTEQVAAAVLTTARTPK